MLNSSVEGLQQAYIDLIQARDNIYHVVAFVLYAYDYLLTFSREVELIWRRKFTGVTVLFILVRYAGMLYRLLGILPSNLNDSSLLSCQALAVLLTLCNLLMVMALILFSALRVYAIWTGEWRPALLVLGLGFIYFGIVMGEMSAEQIFLVIPPSLKGCKTVINMAPSIHVQLYIVSCACESILHFSVLTLTWMRTYGIHKHASEAHIKTSITTLILRDGVSGVVMSLTYGLY
ncbi:hypothetical protein B0H21DRAFT_737813 [Amylocystis lapponica]|nr:hypothetical protein B0H21DRAFT_737813 [Amylocystis lapponica]